MPAQRHELTDRDAAASDDERLAPVELTHDLSAVVAELPLRDLACHDGSVARRATGSVVEDLPLLVYLVDGDDIVILQARYHCGSSSPTRGCGGPMLGRSRRLLECRLTPSGRRTVD